MKIMSIKCPECSTIFTVEDEKKLNYCQYCGTKIFLKNENEHISRLMKEAKIRQAETEKIVKTKELELLERNKILLATSKKLKIRVSICTIIIIIALILLLVYIG